MGEQAVVNSAESSNYKREINEVMINDSMIDLSGYGRLDTIL